MASDDLQQKANFTRLSRLLVDKGTEALRNTFDAIHPPANLPAVLNANQKSLLRLKFRVINNSQWDLLFPSSGNPPDSKTFDVTLLTVLFRNICAFTAPSTGWGAMPPDTDRSMQANILRLKLFRNEIYAHVTSTQVDNATFKSLWQKISQALVELKIPQNDVDDLETSPLGPEEVKIWKEYVEVLKSKEARLEVIECSVEKHGDEIKQLQSALMHREGTCSKKSDDDLSRRLAKHNFKSKIKRKLELFHHGTREWLLRQVNEFVEKKQKSKMLLLTAGPGFGKSVFAAKVCEEFKMKEKLAASHFCDFSNSNLRDPMMMLESLASQMCENIAGFKEKLLDQLRRHHEVKSLKDAFRIYLQNPLDELDLEEPYLVVIDGLDESAADNKDEIMNLITDYFPDLPECIKFLVTSRPENSVAKLSGVQKIKIDSDDANNNADLELYLKACLPRLADKKIDMGSFDWLHSLQYKDRYPSVYEVLAKKCEGSFLYAHYIQIELLKRDDLDKMTSNEIMEFVPEGLDSIYFKYFNRLEGELRAIMHGNLDVFKILEMLAVSKGSLPLGFISRTIGLATDNRETRKIIDEVNQTVSCLLYVSDDLVTVFHKSVIDWLLAESYKAHKYTVNVMDGSKSLWLICEKVFEEIKETVRSGDKLNLTNDVTYALDYGFRYLRACKMEESLFWSVDVVIVHVLLTIYPKSYDIKYVLNLWIEILQDSADIKNKLRERLSWHVLEFDFLHKIGELNDEKKPHYLQSVLTHSPEGYFSDNEKKIAESLLSKVPRFVEYNFNKVEVLPLAAWHIPRHSKTSAVGLSYDKTVAAVADNHETIHVISLPRLVERWQYSTKLAIGALAIFNNANKSISCCVFAPDDSFILFGKLETVLNIAERKEVPFFYGNKERFTSCAYSPKGKRLITGDGSNTIKLWDVSRQSLLASLCADVPVGRCYFSSTGLFIGSSKNHIGLSYHSNMIFNQEVWSCVWNAITWQRCDERKIRDVKLKEPGVFQNKKCKRCFRPRIEELNISERLEVKVCMPFTFSGDECFAFSGDECFGAFSGDEHDIFWKTKREAGIYNGVECSFSSKAVNYTLSVIERTHFSTLAAWTLFDHDICPKYRLNSHKLTAIEDDLWFYADAERLFVFRTLAPIHQQSSRLARETRVLSSLFSPDGSRLATCTSDGYINIWNVHTGKVEQRFKSNQGDSSFACWWSEKFLFVFDFFDRIPSLSKYPVDVNLKILFAQSQQVPLCHLLEEFVSLSAIVDFSEGLLIFECGKTEPVKVLDVSGVGGPRMVTLPGIKPGMSIAVSPGASFVFGINRFVCYIWKRNDAKELDVYEALSNEVFFTKRSKTEQVIINYTCCCFSNDSKVAVVVADRQDITLSTSQCRCTTEVKIFDLVTHDHKGAYFPNIGKVSMCHPGEKLLCLNKDGVLIYANEGFLRFFDMDSRCPGAYLGSSFQRYLTWDSLKQLKLSPKETMLAFPKINGDMEFLRLCIPQGPLMSSIRREAAVRWF